MTIESFSNLKLLYQTAERGKGVFVLRLINDEFKIHCWYCICFE